MALKKPKKEVRKTIDGRARFRVSFIKPKYAFENVDERRAIFGAVSSLKFPFPLRQIKIIDFSKQAVKNKLVVGNHRHINDSGQWEIVLVLGAGKQPLFRFRYKNRVGGKVYEKKLRPGDVVIIPPGCTLAFMALQENAKLLEISNKEYDAANYVKEFLF